MPLSVSPNKTWSFHQTEPVMLFTIPFTIGHTLKVISTLPLRNQKRRNILKHAEKTHFHNSLKDQGNFPKALRRFAEPVGRQLGNLTEVHEKDLIKNKDRTLT